MIANGSARSRFEERAADWDVSVEDLVDTPGSLIGFGHSQRQPVVLKVVKRPDEEWVSGRTLDAFLGHGVVRAMRHCDGAVLLERLVPGTSLVAEGVPEDEATAIIADVIRRMSPAPAPHATPAIESWAEAFERFKAGGSTVIPITLVDAALRVYMDLCATQSTRRLLHGDLHHHNVLRDAQRGWLAIDPKGVVGEPAYEVGAALRNPCETPALFAESSILRRRVDCFAETLQLDATRILGWAFAQAVLAAAWELEDDGVLDAGKGWLTLANVIRPML